MSVTFFITRLQTFFKFSTFFRFFDVVLFSISTFITLWQMEDNEADNAQQRDAAVDTSNPSDHQLDVVMRVDPEGAGSGSRYTRRRSRQRGGQGKPKVNCFGTVFSRPYWVVRSRLWYDVLSVCLSSVCNVCIVAKPSRARATHRHWTSTLKTLDTSDLHL